MIALATILTSMCILVGVAAYDTNQEHTRLLDQDMPDEESVALAFLSACLAFGALATWLEVFK